MGEGPFTCELFGAEGDALREAGGEYGAATGRPRRVGGFDVVASRYGVQIQGVDSLALTKLDVLEDMEQIPVCVAYEVNGERTEVFPSGDALTNAKPIYEYLPGFGGKVAGVTKFEELPENAQKYVRYLEQAVGCPIQYVSTGADRDSYIQLF